MVKKKKKKHLPIQETQVQPWAGKIPLEEEMAIHSTIPAWEIPWAEELCGLQSLESQRVGHDLVTEQQ